MSTLNRTYTFSGQPALPSLQVESELQNVVDTWNNHDKGTSRWTVMDATTLKRVGTTIIPVLQVVTATSNTQFTTTNAAFQNTNLAASITPSSTANKILVLASGTARNDHMSLTIATYTIDRSGTNIGNGANGLQKLDGSTNIGVDPPLSMMVLDSPASVSALTYTVQVKSTDGASTVGFGYNLAMQTIILVELGF